MKARYHQLHRRMYRKVYRACDIVHKRFPQLIGYREPVLCAWEIDLARRPARYKPVRNSVASPV